MNELFYNWLASFGVPYKENLDGSYNFENWDDKTVPTQEEINSKKIELDKEWESKAYARLRQLEYPNLQECIHALLDGGDTLTELKTKRLEIKQKYPKPT